MKTSTLWVVTLDKSRSTWSYFTRNPEGGGFGSCYCGPQYIALSRAIESIPDGAQYGLIVNGRNLGLRARFRVLKNSFNAGEQT